MFCFNFNFSPSNLFLISVSIRYLLQLITLIVVASVLLKYCEYLNSCCSLMCRLTKKSGSFKVRDSNATTQKKCYKSNNQANTHLYLLLLTLCYALFVLKQKKKKGNSNIIAQSRANLFLFFFFF